VKSANNGVQQNALSGLLKSQYSRGLQGWGGSLSQEAGLRGMLGNQSVQQAFQQAMGLAGQRANIWSGGSPPLTQPNYNMANALTRAADIGLTSYGIYKNSQPPKQPSGDSGGGGLGQFGIPTGSGTYGM